MQNTMTVIIIPVHTSSLHQTNHTCVMWIFRKIQKYSLSLEDFLHCTFHNAPFNIIMLKDFSSVISIHKLSWEILFYLI